MFGLGNLGRLGGIGLGGAGGAVTTLFSRLFSTTASLGDDATYARGSTGTVVDFRV